jgi:hypothetical protein
MVVLRAASSAFSAAISSLGNVGDVEEVPTRQA